MVTFALNRESPVNFELFIVKRSIRSHRGDKSGTNSLVGISYVAIALSMIIMILSVSIITGFKKEIKDKLTGFGGHIQISRVSEGNPYENEPISLDNDLVSELRQLPDVTRVNPYATKTAIVKAGKELQGILLKGVDTDFDWSFFAGNLVSGSLPLMDQPDSARILVSRSLANLLGISVGQKLIVYLVQDPPSSPRPFYVSGIYSTGLDEYDRLYVYCHIGHIRDAARWEPGEISGYEIALADAGRSERAAESVRAICDRYSVESHEFLQVSTLREMAPGFFDFLSLTDTNVWVILFLMLLIAGFNMISGILIIILDRTRLIGVLKALGADSRSINRIFLYQALYITGKGLVYGNLIGILLAWLQYRFRVIPLDPASYFLDAVPILLNPIHLLLLNTGTVVLTLLMMLIPAGILTRISPDKTIKFD